MSQPSALPAPPPAWLPPGEWPLPSRFLHVGDDTIHYIDVGKGPMILFVEAGMWSFIRRDVINQLCATFRCVALDFPGTGLSSRTTRDRVSIAAYADVLDAVIDRLRLDDITLVLHDLGGAVGLTYAASHPDRIRGLAACQTFGWPPEQAALRFMLSAMGSAPVRTLNVATNLIPRITAHNYGVGRHLTRAGCRAFLGGLADRRKRRSFHYLIRDARRSTATLAAAEQALRDPLATKPLLTIFGQKQDPFGYQKRWQELYPHAAEHVVAGGHHFPMKRRPWPLRRRPAGLRLLIIHPATRARAARPIPAGHRQITNDNPRPLKPPHPTTAAAIRQPLPARAATRSQQPLRH